MPSTYSSLRNKLHITCQPFTTVCMQHTTDNREVSSDRKLTYLFGKKWKNIEDRLKRNKCKQKRKEKIRICRPRQKQNRKNAIERARKKKCASLARNWCSRGCSVHYKIFIFSRTCKCQKMEMDPEPSARACIRWSLDTQPYSYAQQCCLSLSSLDGCRWWLFSSSAVFCIRTRHTSDFVGCTTNDKNV